MEILVTDLQNFSMASVYNLVNNWQHPLAALRIAEAINRVRVITPAEAAVIQIALTGAGNPTLFSGVAVGAAIGVSIISDNQILPFEIVRAHHRVRVNSGVQSFSGNFPAMDILTAALNNGKVRKEDIECRSLIGLSGNPSAFTRASAFENNSSLNLNASVNELIGYQSTTRFVESAMQGSFVELIPVGVPAIKGINGNPTLSMWNSWVPVSVPGLDGESMSSGCSIMSQYVIKVDDNLTNVVPDKTYVVSCRLLGDVTYSESLVFNNILGWNARQVVGAGNHGVLAVKLSSATNTAPLAARTDAISIIDGFGLGSYSPVSVTRRLGISSNPNPIPYQPL